MKLLAGRLLGFSLGLAAVFAQPLSAEDEDALIPRLPSEVPGVMRTAVVSLELIGRGMIPTARVGIANRQAVPLDVARTWTYEVVPQNAVIDDGVRARLVSDNVSALDQLLTAPGQTVWLVMSPRQLFREADSDPIHIAPYRSWGHDHLLDLRLAKLPRGSIAFVRLVLNAKGVSAWKRVQLPDVPDLPLVRFADDARKLDDPAFARAAQRADVVFTASASGDPWTRTLTVEPKDPLAPTVPRVLLDGRTAQVFDDGVPCRFAVAGYRDGVFASDARVVAVMPLR